MYKFQTKKAVRGRDVLLHLILPCIKQNGVKIIQFDSTESVKKQTNKNHQQQ